MDKNIIKKIIEAGNLAPSGGNSQPWKFVVKNNVIKILLLPQKDHKVLNFKNRGTYIAAGALLENISVAAEAHGFDTNVEFLNSEPLSLFVTLRPLLGKKKNAFLYKNLFTRHSNRKPFECDSLSQEQKDFVFDGVKDFPECEVAIVEGKKISHAAEELTLDTVITLQNQHLHEQLFKEIIWKENEQRDRGGLYIKTMEMKAPKSLVFKLFSVWQVVNFLTKHTKILLKIRGENITTATSTGLIAAIAVDDKDVDFIKAGQLMENIWLRASASGFELHIMAGVVFMWQQAVLGGLRVFSESEKSILHNAHNKLLKLFGFKKPIIAVTFRIGKAKKPMATSYKRSPDIQWD